MKNATIILFVLITFLVSACAGQNSDDPSSATLQYLTALAEKDKNRMINLSCKSWEEQASLEADALLSVGAELNNVSCSTVGSEKDFQLVKCTGSLDLTYNDEIRSIDLSLRTYHMALENGQWRVCSYK